MELAGIAAAFINHYLWLWPIVELMRAQHQIHEFTGYAASSVLLVGYWVIFRTSYVLRSIETPRQERISTIAAVVNSGSLLVVMAYQSVHPELSFLFLLIIGAVEFTLGQLPLTRRRRSAFVVLTTLGSCLIASAFPRRFANTPLSISWLAEGQTLFLAGLFLKEIVFRRLGLLGVLLAWMYMLGGDFAGVLFGRIYGNESAGGFGLAFFFGFASLVLYADAQWVPRRWMNLIDTAGEQLCLRRLSHMAGVLAFAAAWIAWPGAWTAVAWAALALALSYIGSRWQVREISIDGFFVAAAAVARVFAVNLPIDTSYAHAHWLSVRIVTVSIVAALMYLTSRSAGLPGIITRERLGPLYTWVASGLIATLAWYEIQPVGVALAWCLLGLVLLEIGIAKSSWHFRFQAYVAFVSSFLRIFFVNLNAVGDGPISPRVYTIVPLALSFYYAYSRLINSSHAGANIDRRVRAAELLSLLGLFSLVALMRFELDADLVAVGWAATALVLLAVAWKTGRRLYLRQGVLLAFFVLFRAGLHNLYQRSYFPAPFGHGPAVTVAATASVLFLALPFAFRLCQIEQADNSANIESPDSSRSWLRKSILMLDRRPEQVFFFIPFVLLTTMLAIEVRVGLVTLVWGIEACVGCLINWGRAPSFIPASTSMCEPPSKVCRIRFRKNGSTRT